MFQLVRYLLLLTVFNLAGCRVDWDRIDSGVIRLHPVEDGAPIGHGSAFAINDKGDFVTNYHVVESAVTSGGKIKLMAVESIDPLKLHQATVTAASKEQDLAIVRISGLARTPLTLATSTTKGEVVKSIGFPGGIELNNMFINPQRTSGTISGEEAFQLGADTKKLNLLIHTATILGGNSGGPLVDTCGRVVGVNVAKTASNLDLGDILQGLARLMKDQGSGQVQLNTQEGFFFAINVSELITLLQQKHIAFNESSGECRPAGAASGWLTGLLVAMGVMLLLLTVGYLQLRKTAPGGRVDSRYISQLIRGRAGGNEMQSENRSGHTRFVRDADGRIRRVDGTGREGNRQRDVQQNRQQEQTPQQPAPPPLLFRLISEQGHWPDIPIFQGDHVVLGRDPNHCNLCIEGDLISRQHVEIFVDDRGILKVHDLGSSNGTFVDHAKVPEGAKGSDVGAVLSVGNRLILGSEAVVYRVEQV